MRLFHDKLVWWELCYCSFLSLTEFDQLKVDLRHTTSLARPYH